MNSDNKPWAYIFVVQKVFLLGLFLGKLIFRGLVFGGNFAFQNGLGLTIKQLKMLTKDNSLKPLTLTVHGLRFGRAYYWKDISV